MPALKADIRYGDVFRWIADDIGPTMLVMAVAPSDYGRWECVTLQVKEGSLVLGGMDYWTLLTTDPHWERVA